MLPFVRQLLITATVALGVTVLMASFGSALVSPSPRLPSSASTGERCFDALAGTLSASPVEGSARLCAYAGRLRASMRLQGLRAGEVYTAWLAYFEQPSACLTVPCQVADLLGDDPPGVLGRVDGLIQASAGEAELHGDLRGLRVVSGAQITLLLLGHGRANEESSQARARQLLSPQTPELGVPLAGTVTDGGQAWPLAHAVFLVP